MWQSLGTGALPTKAHAACTLLSKQFGQCTACSAWPRELATRSWLGAAHQGWCKLAPVVLGILAWSGRGDGDARKADSSSMLWPATSLSATAGDKTHIKAAPYTTPVAVRIRAGVHQAWTGLDAAARCPTVPDQCGKPWRAWPLPSGLHPPACGVRAGPHEGGCPCLQVQKLAKLSQCCCWQGCSLS